MLGIYYQLPIIFLSGTQLVENNDNILITMKSPDDRYYIIKSPGIKPDEPSKYRLMGLGDTVYIPLTEFPKSMRIIINDIVNGLSETHKPVIEITELLSSFKEIKRDRKPVKKLDNFVLKEADEPLPTVVKDAIQNVDDTKSDTIAQSKKI